VRGWGQVGGRGDEVDEFRAEGADGQAGALEAVQNFLQTKRRRGQWSRGETKWAERGMLRDIPDAVKGAPWGGQIQEKMRAGESR